jgi:hypothetical protein
VRAGGPAGAEAERDPPLTDTRSRKLSMAQNEMGKAAGELPGITALH